MKKTTETLEIAGKTLTLEVGELAQQSTSSVLARLGDTMVLVTVVLGKESNLGYFPLTVDYVERLYAGGKIKGSRWVKREGRPSDEAILTARLIDRSIRPLFPKSFKKEVQVIITLLSVDGENEPDILSIIATSAALTISKIPWKGPVSAVRMGLVKDNGNSEIIVNPGGAELEFSSLDLIVSSSKEKTLMIEAGAFEVGEDITLKAIEKAQGENKRIIEFIEALAKKVGAEKEKFTEDTTLPELAARIEKAYKKEVLDLIPARLSKEGGADADSLIDAVYEDESKENPKIDKALIAEAIEKVLFKSIRHQTLTTGKRPDGRDADEIRPISSIVGILPRTHGSAIFQRGQTQALTVVTLGSPRLEQLIESAEGEETKKYIHHYSMPAYSVGETGRVGSPSRREIGHGALAERAIEPVIPKQEEFPYTIRVVSEILSSNGSTSMAATCGSTLALMDAGVPIKSPVAGIAIGMVSDGEKYKILKDIIGLEDFSGDMDFKVAGTKEGITAIQLDVKNDGLTLEQIKETFEKAKDGRIFILEKMLATLPQVREEVSQYAPKIELVKVPVEKIGEVIGPGGRMIKSIIAETGAMVDVEDDGSVAISGTSEDSVKRAVEWVKGLTREVVAGEQFEGEVKRILPFGAFVEILPGKEGMVHVSKMSHEFVNNPKDVVEIGQKVKVKVMEIDEQGRINLTMLMEDKPAGAAGPGPRREQRPEHPLSMQFKRERRSFGNRPRFRR
jgi:polyribonucleotide nucleotidyltransferase